MLKKTLLFTLFLGCFPFFLKAEFDPIPMAKMEQLLQLADQYVGTRYCYGGTGEKCFDCSGFVYSCFKKIGVKVPRSSSAQAAGIKGKTIHKIEHLQRGDLIFFGWGNGGVSHVGIVVKNDANGTKFIHASTSRGIRYDYYQTWDSKRFIKGIRIFEGNNSMPSKEEKPKEDRSDKNESKKIKGRKFPFTSKKLVNLKDIQDLSPCDIKIMKNEIYGVNGYKFSINRKMVQYFNQQQWYKDKKTRTKDAQFVFDRLMNDVERKNVLFLKQYEGDCN